MSDDIWQRNRIAIRGEAVLWQPLTNVEGSGSMPTTITPQHAPNVEYDWTQGYRGGCRCGWNDEWRADQADAITDANHHAAATDALSYIAG